MSCETIKNRVLDAIGCIRDPERPCTLEELGVITEESVEVTKSQSSFHIIITWEPTAPHCAFANNIGLSMLYKIKQELSEINMKVQVILKEGSHLTKLESKD
jgi:metal-sulfur cluster biosynthetic enzyme